MFKAIKLLKKYYKLANLKKSLLTIQFIFLLIPALLSTLSPVLTAQIISALTIYDFSKAIYILSIDFLVVIVSAILYFLYHILSRKINNTLYQNFNDYIYENIKKNKNISKLNLPTITNITMCIEFNKNFLFKFCFLLKAIFTLAIIFYFNYIISLVIIGVSVLTFFILRITDKQIQQNTKILSNTQQESLDLLNNIHKGEMAEENLNVSEILKTKYFNFVEAQSKTSNKISLFYNINNNFISLILKLAVFLATMSLIGEIKSTTLTLSIYLVLTPYLTSSAQNLISFFSLFTEFGNLENILNELDSLKFVENPIKTIDYNFENYNLTLYKLSGKNNNCAIKNINTTFEFGKTYLITSNNKNELFLLLSLIKRNANTDSGTIFISDKNVMDLPIEVYKKIICSTNRNPFLYNISIIENLLMLSKNKKYIKKIFTAIGINKILNELPQKENSIADEYLSDNLKFILGIIKCAAADAKIICVENFPYEIEQEYKTIIEKLFHFLANKHTLIIFENPNNLNISFDQQQTFSHGTLKEF